LGRLTYLNFYEIKGFEGIKWCFLVKIYFAKGITKPEACGRIGKPEE
jgi:hypothetical protein